jgi:hypothetical protein
VELYYRYETFLPGKAQRAVAMLAERMTDLLSFDNDTDIVSLDQPTTAAPVCLAERLDDDGGRARIAVYSARVSFPALCPRCARPPASVATLPVSRNIENGVWFVPACVEHCDLGSAIRIENWKARTSQLVFSLRSPKYAEAFLALNSIAEEHRQNPDADQCELAVSLQEGTRFVVYQYAIGAMFVAMLNVTDAKRIAPGQSRLVSGLPYVLSSVIGGWWSIPSGPIFTLRAVIGNLRGGIDVSGVVARVLTGQPVSASCVSSWLPF